MVELARFRLDERGFAFVRGQLSAVNTYCSALASRIDREKGSVFTVAPVETAHDRLYQFSAGGLLATNRDENRRMKTDNGWIMQVDNLKAEQAKLIVKSLRGSPSRSCVVDDFNPEWADTRREYDLGETAFGIGKEVYHWFDRRHDEDRIVSTLQQADRIWHGVSAVADCPLPPIAAPTREWLVRHATTAIAIFCSAYDGEGFVGWRVSNG
jgi:hypothetical protein